MSDIPSLLTEQQIGYVENKEMTFGAITEDGIEVVFCVERNEDEAKDTWALQDILCWVFWIAVIVVASKACGR